MFWALFKDTMDLRHKSYQFVYKAFTCSLDSLIIYPTLLVVQRFEYITHAHCNNVTLAGKDLHAVLVCCSVGPCTSVAVLCVYVGNHMQCLQANVFAVSFVHCVQLTDDEKWVRRSTPLSTATDTDERTIYVVGSFRSVI